MDPVKAFSDLARPFAIVSTSGAAAWATVTIARRVESFEGAAVYIAAVYAGLASLYGFKAWENAKAGGQAATVAVAQATPTPPPGTAIAIAAPDVNAKLEVTDSHVPDIPDQGELPADQRVLP